MTIPSWDLATEADVRQLEAATGWFYRTRVKMPRDTVAQIAAECALSPEVVEAWIAEAQRLLCLRVDEL